MTDLDRLHKALADRYRIVRTIGQGGMADVYLAEDLRHRREVALKVLRSDLALRSAVTASCVKLKLPPI